MPLERCAVAVTTELCAAAALRWLILCRAPPCDRNTRFCALRRPCAYTQTQVQSDVKVKTGLGAIRELLLPVVYAGGRGRPRRIPCMLTVQDTSQSHSAPLSSS